MPSPEPDISANPLTPPAGAPATPSTGKTILIAEDDPFISRMYEIKLQGVGYKVVIKNNGRDALEAIKSEHPNLAILDINMPELSGLDVLAALQGEGFDFSNMPVIVLTNSSELSDRKRAQSFGADYLVKAELTPRQVLDLIAGKLGITKPAEPAA